LARIKDMSRVSERTRRMTESMMGWTSFSFKAQLPILDSQKPARTVIRIPASAAWTRRQSWVPFPSKNHVASLRPRRATLPGHCQVRFDLRMPAVNLPQRDTFRKAEGSCACHNVTHANWRSNLAGIPVQARTESQQTGPTAVHDEMRQWQRCRLQAQQ
jgi:hypothetical protein